MVVRISGTIWLFSFCCKGCFFAFFKYINLIETGNPHYLAGMSGIELAKELIDSGKASEVLDRFIVESK